MIEPRELEDVSIGDAIGSLMDSLIMAETQESGGSPDRVLPATSNERVWELRSMPYPEFLESPEWIETARRMKWAGGRQCHICHASLWLDVHHLTYERRGEEFFSDLVVLCRRCHFSFHRLMPKDK